jgi:hypothetical protein
MVTLYFFEIGVCPRHRLVHTATYFLIKNFSVYPLWITKGWNINRPFENVKEIHIGTSHPTDILATCRHPHRLNKSSATVSKWLHPETMSWCSSSDWRHDHIRSQCETSGITCKKKICLDLLNMRSLSVCSIDPITNTSAQFSKKIMILAGVLYLMLYEQHAKQI